MKTIFQFSLLLLLAVAPLRQAAADTGGPDAFGYGYIDSDEPALSYNFEDISVSGMVAATAGTSDDFLETVAMGFSFNYYGTAYTDCGICSNGFISFNEPHNRHTDTPMITRRP